MQPIRTMSLLPMKIEITIEQVVPLYQKLAPKIKELKALGMINIDITSTLEINRKTVRKAISFIFSAI